MTDRHRDGADADGAQERDRKHGGVVERQQHPLLAANAELAQQVTGAVDLAAQVLVGERCVRRDERRGVAAAGAHLALHYCTDAARLRCTHLPLLLGHCGRYAARSSPTSSSPSS